MSERQIKSLVVLLTKLNSSQSASVIAFLLQRIADGTTNR